MRRRLRQSHRKLSYPSLQGQYLYLQHILLAVCHQHRFHRERRWHIQRLRQVFALMSTLCLVYMLGHQHLRVRGVQYFQSPPSKVFRWFQSRRHHLL